MIERILLAVDDTPDSLAAARVAVELAAALHATLHALQVSSDGVFDAALAAASDKSAVVRRSTSAAAVLARVATLAESAGVAAQTEAVNGDVGQTVLRAARQWPADLVVVGRSARSTSGGGYVGAQTRHLLEFAEQPVLVVAAPEHR